MYKRCVLIYGEDQSRRARGSIGEEEIATERSSHGDAFEIRDLARPRKDKVAIFDANARTIIITGVLYGVCVYVCMFQARVWLAIPMRKRKQKPPFPACNHARAERQDQGKRCHVAADARHAIMHFYVSARSAGIVIGVHLFRTRAWLGFFGEDCSLHWYSETRMQELKLKIHVSRTCEASSRGVHSVVWEKRKDKSYIRARIQNGTCYFYTHNI